MLDTGSGDYGWTTVSMLSADLPVKFNTRLVSPVKFTKLAVMSHVRQTDGDPSVPSGFRL